jgi:hypothetical protein
MWKKMFVTSFEAFPGETEEKYEQPIRIAGLWSKI